MPQYLLLIHDNADSEASAKDWEQFFAAAEASGFFRGGSEIGNRSVVGNTGSLQPTDHIAGFMRFDSEDKQALLDLLAKHPVVTNGGSVELFEMPSSDPC